jgi:endonuclease/exonuclease/phosphatase family metal-dependent hydrolase
MGASQGERMRAGARKRRLQAPSACMNLMWLGCLVGLLGCSEPTRSGPPGEQGTFSLLTYNVAGLPQGISGSNPERNTPLISPLLNGYDLVLVQEDFVYHSQLLGAADHPYATPTAPNQGSLGDGLNVLSPWPLDSVTRIDWRDCHGQLDSGSDCLTPKGFLRARVEVAQGATLDIYNLHADAGRNPKDVAARSGNFAQLQAEVLDQSHGNAVIISGDFNERYSYADQSVLELVKGAGLSDVWVELERGGIYPASPSVAMPQCGTDEGDVKCERIDKILFRSSATLGLKPVSYTVPVGVFVDANRAPLSDHPPVAATFEYTVSAPL